MSTTNKWFLFFSFICLATAILLPATWAQGKDKAAETAEADEAETAEADPFVVPDGGPEEMVDYLKSLQAGLTKVQRDIPKKRTRAAFIKYRRKVIEYMIKSSQPKWEAADRILDDENATDAQKKIAAKAKFSALGIRAQLRDTKALKAMKGFHDQLVELGLNKMAKQLELTLLQQEIRESLSGDPDAKPLKEIVKKIKTIVAEKPDKDSLRLVHALVTGVEKTDSVEAAVDLCNEFAETLKKSDADGAEKMVKKVEGYARRMQLMGNTMEIEGTLLDGKTLDWNDYKGKVVLVQFWATWCGPCRAEIPNVKKYYKQYHDRGFDVVSISLDRDRKDIEKYLDKPGNELPWPVVFEEGKENAGFDQPMAIRYAINGIPTLILLDREGKVVSENARGANLGKELEKLIGPAEEDEKDKDSEE